VPATIATKIKVILLWKSGILPRSFLVWKDMKKSKIG